MVVFHQQLSVDRNFLYPLLSALRSPLQSPMEILWAHWIRMIVIFCVSGVELDAENQYLQPRATAPVHSY